MCSTKVFRGKDFFTTKLLNRWRNHLGQCHPLAGERRKEKMKGERRKGKEKGEGEREHDFSLGNHNCGLRHL